MNKKILLVEDDAALRQSLCEQLELYEEFSTTEAESGGDGLEQARSGQFDIVLLDVGLPDMDGREVCRLMRQSGVKVPIIMLTVADTDADTILGLDAGANDYISKPFRIGVLLARLRAQLRQHEQSEDTSTAVQLYEDSTVDSHSQPRMQANRAKAQAMQPAPASRVLILFF